MSNEHHTKEKVFTDIYNEHVDAIFRFCYFKTGDKEIATDLAQDVFIKVFNHLDTLIEVENKKAFIYTIAKNTIIDFWRKKKSVHEHDLPVGFMHSVASDQQTDTHAYYSEFLSFVDRLSPTEKEVIILRYVEDLSSKDMAELLGERENTILVRISRATKKLKDIHDGKDRGKNEKTYEENKIKER